MLKWDDRHHPINNGRLIDELLGLAANWKQSPKRRSSCMTKSESRWR
nr:hypothetical protein [Planococcus salinarum]